MSVSREDVQCEHFKELVEEGIVEPDTFFFQFDDSLLPNKDRKDAEKQLCLSCGEISSYRITEHQKNKSCPLHKVSSNKRAAVRAVTRLWREHMGGYVIDLSLIPEIQSQDEAERFGILLKQIHEGKFAVKGSLRMANLNEDVCDVNRSNSFQEEDGEDERPSRDDSDDTASEEPTEENNTNSSPVHCDCCRQKSASTIGSFEYQQDQNSNPVNSVDEPVISGPYEEDHLKINENLYDVHMDTIDVPFSPIGEIQEYTDEENISQMDEVVLPSRGYSIDSQPSSNVVNTGFLESIRQGTSQGFETIGQSQGYSAGEFNDVSMIAHSPICHPSTSTDSSSLICSVRDMFYTGGTEIDPIFRKAVNPADLFQIKDSAIEQSLKYTQGKIRPLKRTVHRDGKYVDEYNEPFGVLPLQLKLNVEDHEILREYAADLLDYDPESEKCPSTNTAETYLRHVCKYMLCTMRLRENRIGQQVSVDDFFFSCDVVTYFFDELKKNKVSLPVQIAFVNSLRNFNRFLIRKLPFLWMFGLRRQTAVYMHDQLAIISGRFSKIKEIAVSRTPKKPTLPYSVICSIIEHPTIVHQVKKILLEFEATRIIQRYSYNYILGYILYVIIIANASRNEPGYKLTMGDIRRMTMEVETTDQGVMRYYLTKFKEPKESRFSQERGSIVTGNVIFDEEMWTLLQKYLQIRQSRTENSSDDQQVFVSYEGRSIKYVRYYLNYFLQSNSIGHLALGCNKIRHSASTAEYKNELSEWLQKSSETAAIAGHTAITQRINYLDVIRMECLVGFRKLRQMSRQHRDSYTQVIQEVTSGIVVKFKSTAPNSEDAFEDDKAKETMEDIPMSERDFESTGASTSKRPAIDFPVVVDLVPAKRTKYLPATEKPSAAEDSDDEMENIVIISDDDDKENAAESIVEGSPTRVIDTFQDAQDFYGEYDVPDSSQVSVVLSLPSQSTQQTEESEAVISRTLPDLTDVASVCDLIRNANAKAPEITTFKLSLQNPDHLLKYIAISRARPIQMFDHLVIKGCKAVNGLGLLLKEGFWLMKSGDTSLVRDHEKRLKDSSLSEEDKEYIKSYRMESCERGKGYIIEGHSLAHKGSIIFGRYSNHSTHKNCQNVTGHVQTISFNGVRVLVLIYRATRTIQEGEQILYSYGNGYTDQPWYSDCPNDACNTGLPDGPDDFDSFPIRRMPPIFRTDDCTSLSQTTSNGLPLPSDTPLEVLLDLASLLITSMDKMTVGPSTFANSVQYVFDISAIAYRCQEKIDTSSLQPGFSFIQLFNFLQESNLSIVLFVSSSKIDRNVRCIRFGPGGPPYDLALHFSFSNKALASVIAVPSGDSLAARISHLPVLQVTEEKAVCFKEDINNEKTNISYHDIIRYLF